MRVGVIVFPGSNCDRDMLRGLDDVLGTGTAEAVWHEADSVDGLDALVLPGGFSWGDYLRCGAMSARAPIMAAVREAAAAGTPVLGVCNGFQVLCEAGLLPGALVRNDSLQFRCEWAELELDERAIETPFTRNLEPGQRLRLPIAHGEGRYHAGEDVLDELEASGRALLRYRGDSPNGSLRAIAGIASAGGNVVGMMPHPERAVHRWMGGDHGGRVLTSLRDWHAEHRTDAATDHATAAGEAAPA